MSKIYDIEDIIYIYIYIYTNANQLPYVNVTTIGWHTGLQTGLHTDRYV